MKNELDLFLCKTKKYFRLYSLLFLFGLCTNIVLSQTVQGTITNDTGQPLPGANILEKGTNNGAVTDFDGVYRINVSENAILVISYVGYQTQEIVVGTQTTINISLALDNQLNEVVIIGYGTVKKSDVTGALSSVGAKDFENQPVTQIDQALQGRAAGVQVTQTNASPGSGSKIRIRGTNSINGSNDPLYVLDGLFVTSIDGLNVNDIESIEVLKDASATAIYGSRGANGVVLITTKNGKAGKVKVSFDSFLTVQSETNRLDIMSAADFARTVNASRVDVGANAPFTDQEISDFEVNGGTDWQDEVLRQGIKRNNQISVSGGSDNNDYYVSLAILDNKGIVINRDYKKYSLRANMNAKVSDKVKVGLNLYLGREEFDGASANVFDAVTYDPTSPARGEDGSYPNAAFASLQVNPLLIPNERIVDRKDHSALGSGYIQPKFGKYFTLNVSGGFEYIDIANKVYSPNIITNGGAGNIENRDRLTLQNTNVLSFNKNLKNESSIGVSLINEQVYIRRNQNEAGGLNFITDSNGFNNLGISDPASREISSTTNNESLLSFAGRVNYNLLNRYLFTATMRADGSSKFSEENRWGYFPSAAFSWKIIQENFMENNNLFNDLKLRVGYGVTGSQGISPLDRRARLNDNILYPINNGVFVTGIAPSNRIANPDLTWEETDQINVGLEFAILSNAIRLTIDYYKKNTTGLLLDLPLADYTGADVITKNIGEIENSGFDFTLDLRPINNEKFSWDNSLTLTANKNKVLDLGDEERIFPGQNFLAGATGGELASVVEVGESLGQLRGYIFDGIYQTDDDLPFGKSAGDSKYKDLNEDGVISSDDITTVGNGLPDFTWGLNSTLTYKNFDLNFLILGSHGQDVYNFTKGQQLAIGGGVPDAVHPDILNRWTPDNPSNEIPAFTTTSQDFLLSTRFLEDGSFVRMKNVTLAYNFSKEVLDKLNINSLRIYTSAENLFTITDYSGFDPELSVSGNSDIDVGIDRSTFPQAKSFTLGLNVTF